MKLLPPLLLLLTACDDGAESSSRTIYEIIPQGVIQAEWTEAQKNCAAITLAYVVRWAECSSEPESALENLEDDGRALVNAACIENDWGMDMSDDCADIWANGTCAQISDQACDLWAPGER